MKPEELSREDLEIEIIAALSSQPWEDVTEDCGDPTAVECLATGWDGERMGTTLFFLSRHEDGDLSLVSCAERDGDEFKCVTRDRFKIEWLWERVVEGRCPTNSD